MKLAVVYTEDNDGDREVVATEKELFNDYPEAIVCRVEKIRRGELRREFGDPLFSALAEQERYRDVDVWKIQANTKGMACERDE